MRSYPCLSLAPCGFIVERCEIEANRLVVHVRSASPTAQCPRCGALSGSLHSRYRRMIHDLPAHGRAVVLAVTARRFRCRTASCPQRIFAERLPEATARSHARRSSRLKLIAYHLGIARGGRPGARLAARLAIGLGADTLLRTVRRRCPQEPTCPRVAGVDDFAWRRSFRYGTIVCDLERRRVVDLLPDRERAMMAAWFSDHPGIEIVTRDRGGGYGEATREALLHARSRIAGICSRMRVPLSSMPCAAACATCAKSSAWARSIPRS